MQRGCREIVNQILSGAREYWLASFSDERREETRAMFKSLAKKSEAEEAVIETAEEWSGMSDEDSKAGALYDTLTDGLFSHDATAPLVGSDVSTLFAKAREKLNCIGVDSEELCTSSNSSWDRHMGQ